MAKDKVITRFKAHCWVLITHKRGVARLCVNCWKMRYMGKHKDFYPRYIDESIMVYAPEAVALPHGVEITK